MWALINAMETRIFGIALAVMLLLGVLELLFLLLGGGSDWLDTLLPDSLTETTPDVALHIDADGVLIRFLSWLYVGKIPLLMLMVVFLAVFGLLGYGVQAACMMVLGQFAPMWLAAVATWFVSLPAVRIVAAGLYRIMPKDETTAQTSADLVGRVGVVVLGEASEQAAAQVRVKDAFGQQHYVMAKADGASLPQGSTVLLVAQEAGQFRIIANPNAHLQDESS